MNNHSKLPSCFRACLVTLAVLLISVRAQALESTSDVLHTSYSLNASDLSGSFLGAGAIDSAQPVLNQLANPAQPHLVESLFAQRQDKKLRSRSEVVREVKAQHNPKEVLKISLNEQGSKYRVRVLMHDGRIRVITVSARR